MKAMFSTLFSSLGSLNGRFVILCIILYFISMNALGVKAEEIGRFYAALSHTFINLKQFCPVINKSEDNFLTFAKMFCIHMTRL